MDKLFAYSRDYTARIYAGMPALKSYYLFCGGGAARGIPASRGTTLQMWRHLSRPRI